MSKDTLFVCFSVRGPPQTKRCLALTNTPTTTEKPPQSSASTHPPGPLPTSRVIPHHLPPPIGPASTLFHRPLPFTFNFIFQPRPFPRTCTYLDVVIGNSRQPPVVAEHLLLEVGRRRVRRPAWRGGRATASVGAVWCVALLASAPDYCVDGGGGGCAIWMGGRSAAAKVGVCVWQLGMDGVAGRWWVIWFDSGASVVVYIHMDSR